MKTETKTNLAQSSQGRVFLHLLAICRGGRFGWHLAGVLRELKQIL